jgi:arginine decarboxylase
MGFKYYKPITSIGFGTYKISAFDDALYQAGIGNYNLVKVSSILPPDCQLYTGDKIPLEDGSPLYIAFEYQIQPIYIETSAGVVVVSATKDMYGLIIEMAELCDESLLRVDLEKATQERLRYRNRADTDYRIATISLQSSKVKEINYAKDWACTFAGVALF